MGKVAEIGKQSPGESHRDVRPMQRVKQRRPRSQLALKDSADQCGLAIVNVDKTWWIGPKNGGQVMACFPKGGKTSFGRDFHPIPGSLDKP